MDQIGLVSAFIGGASHAPPCCSGVRRRILTIILSNYPVFLPVSSGLTNKSIYKR